MRNKYVLLVLFSLILQIGFSQKPTHNTKGGFGAEGYDVVSYFNNNPVKGKACFTVIHNKVKYKFSNQLNRAKFNNNPTKYTPQYGGWCTYAMATTNAKVSVDPKTYEIRNGKLLLFYNSWGINALDKWVKENPDELLKKADENWKKLKNTK